MAAQQRSDHGIDIENPDGPSAQSITNVVPVHRNLPPDDKKWLGAVIRDRGNLELRLRLACQPQIDVVNDVIAVQMPPPGEFAAGQPGGGRQAHRRSGGDGGREGPRGRHRTVAVRLRRGA